MEAKKLDPKNETVTPAVKPTPRSKPNLLADRIEILRYSLPNLFRRNVELSQQGHLWLDVLRKEGIVGITEPEFVQVANHLEEKYFSKLQGKKKADLTSEEIGIPDLFARDTNDQFFREYGASILCEISFRDTALSPILLNPDLTGLFYNYYHRQPFYRNQPVLQMLEFQDGQEASVAGAYHTDRLHQLSLMLLVSDVTEHDTHMEFALRTHNRSLWKHGITLSPESAAEVVKRTEILKCIGEKGMLYIFDASAVHRRCLIPGTSRKILHCNVTTGHHLKPFIDQRSQLSQLASQPRHTRRLFSKLK